MAQKTNNYYPHDAKAQFKALKQSLSTDQTALKMTSATDAELEQMLARCNKESNQVREEMAIRQEEAKVKAELKERNQA